MVLTSQGAIEQQILEPRRRLVAAQNYSESAHNQMA